MRKFYVESASTDDYDDQGKPAPRWFRGARSYSSVAAVRRAMDRIECQNHGECITRAIDADTGAVVPYSALLPSY